MMEIIRFIKQQTMNFTKILEKHAPIKYEIFRRNNAKQGA